VAIYLDSNGHAAQAYTTWECLVGAGAADIIEQKAGQALTALQNFRRDKQDWLFGFLGYDLKNEIERLHSGHFDGIALPDLVFFQPKTVVGIRNGQIEIHTLHHLPQEVFEEIKNFKLQTLKLQTSNFKLQTLEPRLPKPDYLETVERIRQHIIEGDVYEVNLCQEFFMEGADLDPVSVFARLNVLSKAPFAAFMRWHDRYLMCGSPERFLKKQGQKLISQPIKGTRKRGKTREADERIRHELADSQKDRAENVMIVDLVRNDLARLCRPGSVQVEELFGIHTFETVHQMISTVVGEGLPSATDEMTIFPPGSMTGAPKVMAMLLIEQYEHTRRGLYSGSVGYFDPTGDFDFNVVIRSILYNAADQYASIQVGGAIVFDSVPEEEYEECLVKAEAMRLAVLGS